MNKPDIKPNTPEKEKKRIEKEFALDAAVKHKQKQKININQAGQVYA